MIILAVSASAGPPWWGTAVIAVAGTVIGAAASALFSWLNRRNDNRVDAQTRREDDARSAMVAFLTQCQLVTSDALHDRLDRKAKPGTNTIGISFSLVQVSNSPTVVSRARQAKDAVIDLRLGARTLDAAQWEEAKRRTIETRRDMLARYRTETGLDEIDFYDDLGLVEPAVNTARPVSARFWHRTSAPSTPHRLVEVPSDDRLAADPARTHTG